MHCKTKWDFCIIYITPTHVGGRSCVFVLRIYIYFMMNISSIEIVDKLLYDTGRYWWTGSLDELKQFVDKNLEITPYGEMVFTRR